MLIESIGVYNYHNSVSKEKYHNSLEISDLSDNQLNILLFVLIIYVFTTIYVAIKYPIGGNVVISLILALFFSTIFWFIKIIEIIFYGSKSVNKRRKTKSAKSGKGEKKSYYKPIY